MAAANLSYLSAASVPSIWIPLSLLLTELKTVTLLYISKSCRYSRDDLKFIDGEVEGLFKEGIIEPSNSPWRAQVVVTKDESHKKRLAIDYGTPKLSIASHYSMPSHFQG